MSCESIELTIGEQSIAFGSLREFEFALAGRTSLPYEKIAALTELTDDQLLREVNGIRQLERRFVDVVERSMSEPGAIPDFVHDIDLNVISKDYDWRDIFKNLIDLDERFDKFKKVAMVKYMQYLAARQEIVRNTYSTRHAGKKHKGGAPETDGRKSETLIFDLTSVVSSEHGEGEFERLPKGEPIEIPFDQQTSVDVILAKHKFSIVAGEQFQFVDDQDHYSLLGPGKNIVGRDAKSDVVIDPNYRAVSRRHLIIETEGTSLVRLTDISSLGTFVPPQYLDRTGL